MLVANQIAHSELSMIVTTTTKTEGKNMKRIINGKTYNTDTAENVGNGDSGHNIGDCYRRTVEIYRTKKGNYFIVDQTPVLIAIDDEGNFFDGRGDYAYRHETLNIHDFIASWNITDLDAKALADFKIVDA